MIVTMLGSCIAACIRDPVIHLGGMNHFLLPEARPGNGAPPRGPVRRRRDGAADQRDPPARRRRRRLEVKVFGGANVIEMSSSYPIGKHNVEFVEPSSGPKDRGGGQAPGRHLARRIHYFPSTGRVKMRLLKRTADRTLFTANATMTEKSTPAIGGSIELFQ